MFVSLLDELLDHGYRLRFRADRSDYGQTLFRRSEPLRVTGSTHSHARGPNLSLSPERMDLDRTFRRGAALRLS